MIALIVSMQQVGRLLLSGVQFCSVQLHLRVQCNAGALVANAPHLPVHLGAMSEAVRFQVSYYGPGGPGEQEGLQVRCGGEQATPRVGDPHPSCEQ